MRKTLFLIATPLMLSANALAGSYRADFGLEYLAGEIDGAGGGYTPPPVEPGEPPAEPPAESGSGSDDYDGWGVSGQVFLTPVDTSRGPLKLAPFLSRASSAGGRYGSWETDETGVETELWQVFTRFVASTGWLIEAEFATTELDAGIVDSDTDEWRIAAGYYIAQDTQVRLGYDNSDDDLSEYDRWAVDIVHVQQLDNGMTWSLSALFGLVSGDTALGSDDDGSDILVSGSWFFRPDIGIGLDLNFSDRDESGDIEGFELWANYFVTEKISLNLSYVKEEADRADLETDALIFEAKYRF